MDVGAALGWIDRKHSLVAVAAAGAGQVQALVGHVKRLGAAGKAACRVLSKKGARPFYPQCGYRPYSPSILEKDPVPTLLTRTMTDSPCDLGKQSEPSSNTDFQ